MDIVKWDQQMELKGVKFGFGLFIFYFCKSQIWIWLMLFFSCALCFPWIVYCYVNWRHEYDILSASISNWYYLPIDISWYFLRNIKYNRIKKIHESNLSNLEILFYSYILCEETVEKIPQKN